MSSPVAAINTIPKKLPAGQMKYIEFMYHVVDRLDFIGDVVKQQMIDSIVFAPVEFQHELVTSFLEKNKNKVISKEITDKKKQNVIDKKNADKQAKLDEKKRIKEEKELAKKEERERVKEETRLRRQQEKEENNKKKKDLKIKNSKKNPIVVSDNITSTTSIEPNEIVANEPSTSELATEEFVKTPNKDDSQNEKSPSIVKKAIKKRVTKKKKEEET
jgi:hypothetical protein